MSPRPGLPGQLPANAILWGGTGQAKVIRPILEERGCAVVAIIDDTPGLDPPFDDLPLCEGLRGFEQWAERRLPGPLGFAVTMGNPHGRVRLRLHDLLTDRGLSPVDAIHPSSVIDSSARIGAGAQVLAGTVIQPQVEIGRQCIVNTRASIDHECRLADGVEVGPGATLCGLVALETNVWVGAGATVLPRIRVGADSIIGAGAVVTKNVPPNSVMVGVPARPLDRARRQHE